VSLLDRLLGRAPARAREDSSRNQAKKRLKLVLEYDRAQLSPGELALIRDEIISSISRHVQVSSDEVEVKLEEGGRLVAEIPLGTRRVTPGGAESAGS
jgi:cell division topological specificity factor